MPKRAPALRQSRKAVMFTNYGKVGTVSKRASNLLFDNLHMFSDMSVHGLPTANYAEMSQRTIYEAIEKDFDALDW
jgi:hypothetical protein